MERLTIVKVGGKVVEETTSMEALLDQFSKISSHKILVHGGGRAATAMANRLGIETQMIDGRRITTQEMLEVVTMIYGGLVNKKIVAGLQSRGCNAFGLTGADLNLLRASKRKITDIDYGYVGDVQEVNTRELRLLLAENAVPVVAPLTHDGHGTMLNTNADTIASELAIELAEFFNVYLFYCFEKSGVLLNVEDNNSIIHELDEALFHDLKSSGNINEGMLPKLETGFRAKRRGVKEVIISSAENLASGSGTRII